MNRHAKASTAGPTRLLLASIAVLALTLALGAAIAFAAAPTIGGPNAIEVKYTTALVSGAVTPEGKATTYRFQYSTQADFTGALNGPEGTVPASASETGVSGTITGLQPKTTYYLRLVAENSDGKSEALAASPFETLEAAAPIPGRTFATLVGDTAATLNSKIDPAGAGTTYHFEYVDQAGYEANEFDDATSTPEGTIDGLADPLKAVSAEITGFQPATTYRYRVLAENAKGSSVGGTHTFHTAAPEEEVAEGCPNAVRRSELHATRLPDCRAYEMVSPAEKNGGYVLSQSSRTQVAADGNAVSFPSLTAFPGSKGSSLTTQYLSQRTAQPGTSGWSTRSIIPLGGTNTLYALVNGGGSNIPAFLGAYTPDLSAAIYRSWRPLTGAPNVETITNLYRIDDLRSGGLSPTLLSDAFAPLPHFAPEALVKPYHWPSLVGASTDLSHVVFEENLNLTADAPPLGFVCEQLSQGLAGCPYRLYENAGGEVRLVGRIPQGSETECDDESASTCEAAPSSVAGISASSKQFSTRMVSADGSRILFQAPANGGNIYLREDGHRTVQLNVSEDGSPEFQPAKIWDASRDGSRVFFSTEEQLVATDTDTAPDLYMYEVEKPAGERLTLISESGTGIDGFFGGMIGASDDGHYAYFFSGGQLVPGEPVSLEGLYAWHDGALSYVGDAGGIDVAGRNSPRIQYNFEGEAKGSRITPDGRHLLFALLSDKGVRGRGGFTSYDQEGFWEFYLYDAGSGHLSCATCNPSGEAATEEALIDQGKFRGISQPSQHLSQALSDDGRYVFFNSAEALVPGDTNGTWDAYEYDNQSGKTSLISTGNDSRPSFFTEASTDGHDVFFATVQRLSARDTDTAYDLYDARAGGGMPEPPPGTAPCNGDSCLSPSPPPPGAAAVASDKPGAGNPPLSCPRGAKKVRRAGKARCEAKTRKPQAKKKGNAKKGSANRTANANRRTAK